MPKVLGNDFRYWERLLKIVHLSADDNRSGAGRGAYRLHRGLRRLGVESWMLVDRKFDDDQHTLGPENLFAKTIARGASHIDGLPLHLYRNRTAREFSVQWLPRRVASRVHKAKPDILHLHWTCFGFVPVTAIPRLARPVIWTLHDMWPFTGGCHYSGDCMRYTADCGACPHLSSRHEQDLSRLIWRRKKHAWSGTRFTAIATSNWMAEQARRSALLGAADTRVIPVGLDTGVFRPLPKHEARHRLGLAPDVQVILYGAISATSDPRKGYKELSDALEQIANSVSEPRPMLLVFGASAPPAGQDLPLPAHFLGPIHDDSMLAAVYSAADVMVVPSRSEAFGQTALEAMACGTPVAAFATGGLLDIVEHKVTGYLAAPCDTVELAYGIRYLLDARSPDGNEDPLSAAARQRVMRLFDIDKVAATTKDLYDSLMIDRTATTG